jgi:hypothetical protein
MKSKLFTNNLTLGKDFTEDISTIASLEIPPNIMPLIPKTVSKFYLAKDAETEAETLDSIRAKWNVSLRELNVIIGIGGFLLKNLGREDTSEDIMEDLKTLNLIEKEKLTKLRPFIDSFVSEYKSSFSIYGLAASIQRAALKTIRGVNHWLDLRVVILNSPDIGESIENYKPNINGLAPVVVFSLRLRNDDQPIIFQMDRYALKIFQDELAVAKKELDESVKFIGRDKVSIDKE